MKNKLSKRKNIKAVGMFTIFLLLICLTFFMLREEKNDDVNNVNTEVEEDNQKICVVIDAGHGGMDPGKVGINGVLEKNINLSIALQLKEYLESENIKVVMTREDDNGLYKDSDSNKKVTDMKKRLEIIEENDPELAVSIHQNSYPQESVSGVQVFYYKDSIKGQKLANIMQEQLIEALQPEKRREPKDNTTYYLLKKTSIPLIIIECGFLSNMREAQQLEDFEYQKIISRSICEGILKYLNCI